MTTVRGGNRLFENDGSGRFRDISRAAGLDYVGHSSGAVFFDYDRDGRLDLFLANVGVYTTDAIGGEGYRYYVGIEPPHAAVGLTSARSGSTVSWKHFVESSRSRHARREEA